MISYKCQLCGQKNLTWDARAKAFLCLSTECSYFHVPTIDGLSRSQVAQLISRGQVSVLPVCFEGVPVEKTHACCAIKDIFEAHQLAKDESNAVDLGLSQNGTSVLWEIKTVFGWRIVYATNWILFKNGKAEAVVRNEEFENNYKFIR